MCLQLLEGIKAEIAAIKADPDLSDEEKQERAKNKMQALYAASGCAKVKGALQQVERALQEGNGPALPLVVRPCRLEHSSWYYRFEVLGMEC